MVLGRWTHGVCVCVLLRRALLFEKLPHGPSIIGPRRCWLGSPHDPHREGGLADLFKVHLYGNPCLSRGFCYIILKESGPQVDDRFLQNYVLGPSGFVCVAEIQL